MALDCAGLAVELETDREATRAHIIKTEHAPFKKLESLGGIEERSGVEIYDCKRL